MEEIYETVWVIVIEGNPELIMPERLRKINDTLDRTRGCQGWTDNDKGRVIVYDTAENAEAAWFKLADVARVSTVILTGKLDVNRHTLVSVGEPTKAMRLN